MPFIRAEKRKGNTYYYLVKSVREGKRVFHKYIKYLGTKMPEKLPPTKDLPPTKIPFETFYTGNISGYTVFQRQIFIFVQHIGRHYYITRLIPALPDIITKKRAKDFDLYDFDLYIFVPLVLEKKRIHKNIITTLFNKINLPAKIKSKIKNIQTYNDLYVQLYDQVQKLKISDSRKLTHVIELSKIYDDIIPIDKITIKIAPRHTKI